MSNDAIIHIVDDDTAMCESLRWLIESVGFTVKIYPGAKAFLDNYEDAGHGCLLLDVRMPEMSGLELQEQLNKNHIEIPIIFITGHGDVPMAVRAMKAGALEFLNKPFNDQELLDCINRAIEYDSQRRQSSTERNHIMERLEQLTTRERQVLKELVTGKLNKVIAADLELSIKTIELHRSNIMRKLQSRSLAQIISMIYAHDIHLETIE
ncbi:MAG: response regulator transcription factor [Coxiellaceae bacterium]|nr:response regulator transcription factor [Coxiellaceae bacterium]